MTERPAPSAERSSIATSTGVISLATAASRVLGFIRDILIAKLFGIGFQAQAFVVAFRLPNLLRDLVAEGAVTSAVVPVLSASRSTTSPEQFWRLAQALCVRMAVAVGLLGVLGTAFAPWLVGLIAPGFAGDPEKWVLSVRLTRLMFPFITLVGLWAFFSGLLNSLRHFAMPALGPAVLNLAMIGGCVWLSPHLEPAVLGLAWGVMAGGFLQFLMQVPTAHRLGFRFRWVWHHAGSREVMRLLMPRLLGSAVHQLSVFFNTILASLAFLAGEGAVAALYFANRLIQLPLALFGTASAQASLPSLSEQAATRDLTAFRSTLLAVLRMVSFVTLPAAVGLFVLASPIVQVLLERGAFDRASTTMTAEILRLFAIGLIAYAASKVFTGAFYALKDTRTPVWLALEAFVVNVALAVWLITPLGVKGLALATALASLLNAWRLLGKLERRLDVPLVRDLGLSLARMSLPALLMGVGCWLIWRRIEGVLPSLVGLPAVMLGGIILYGAGCRLARVAELSSALRWLTRSQGSSSLPAPRP